MVHGGYLEARGISRFNSFEVLFSLESMQFVLKNSY
jgi:hypothetical protein